MSWKGKPERFRGISDWRLQLVVLSIITFLLYWLVVRGVHSYRNYKNW